MKSFHYITNDGRQINCGETLTVRELQAILKDYPSDMPVLATWEGIYTFFRDASEEGGFYVETPKQWENTEKCLVFDVDQ